MAFLRKLGSGIQSANKAAEEWKDTLVAGVRYCYRKLDTGRLLVVPLEHKAAADTYLDVDGKVCAKGCPCGKGGEPVADHVTVKHLAGVRYQKTGDSFAKTIMVGGEEGSVVVPTYGRDHGVRIFTIQESAHKLPVAEFFTVIETVLELNGFPKESAQQGIAASLNKAVEDDARAAARKPHKEKKTAAAAVDTAVDTAKAAAVAAAKLAIAAMVAAGLEREKAVAAFVAQGITAEELAEPKVEELAEPKVE